MKKKNNLLDLRETIISVIFVTSNDAGIIEDVLKKTNEVFLKNYPNYEILIIDNNSSDDTLGRIRALYKQIPHIKIIRLSKTSNMDIAFTAGLDNCIGDFVALFDIHLVSPDILPIFLNKLFENYDIVTAKTNKYTRSVLSPSYIFLSLIEKISTHDFSYESTYLLALNRKAVNSITKIRRKSRNFSYISNSIGFRKTTITYKALRTKRSKIRNPNFIELMLIVSDIIISNSFRPIRILTALGMIVSLVFLSYIFFVAIIAIFFNIYYAPKGWISLASATGIMFFLLFSILTVISEYIIRILNESRSEPLYFIAEEMDKSVINSSKKRLNVI